MTLRDPSMPPGRIRFSKPAPFRRPSITIGAGPGAPRREWGTVPAHRLAAGDILPGVGLIDTIDEQIISGNDLVVRWTITVRGGQGNVTTLTGDAEVWAFTAPAPR